MHIGEVIRENRKGNNMTQAEMADRLGVSAPAVNKWENGNSQPDIMLLAPIARLLNITLDTLLSFQEELTTEEINSMIHELDLKLKDETYENVFQWAKRRIVKYPNSEQLIWGMALVLDAWRLAKDVPDKEKYENYINDCYVRALDSEDEIIRSKAADSLYGFYLRKEQYEKAEEYLNFLSIENPDRKRKQAFIYSKTDRVNEAYKAYEEILFSGYQMMNMVLQGILMLAMTDKNREKSHMIVKKQSELADIFEMGEYNKVSCGLDLATAEKDVEATIEVMEKMLASIQETCGFTKSALYEHMEFRDISEKFILEINKKLLAYFSDEETYGYMKESKRWQALRI